MGPHDGGADGRVAAPLSVRHGPKAKSPWASVAVRVGKGWVEVGEMASVPIVPGCGCLSIPWVRSGDRPWIRHCWNWPRQLKPMYNATTRAQNKTCNNIYSCLRRPANRPCSGLPPTAISHSSKAATIRSSAPPGTRNEPHATAHPDYLDNPYALRRDAVSCKPRPKSQPPKLHPQIGYRRFTPARGGQVTLRFVERSNPFIHLREWRQVHRT